MPLQLRSLIKETTHGAGELEISLVDIPMPQPESPDDVVVHIEAAPINPSDLGLLFGQADMSQARQSGTKERPIITAPLSPAALKAASSRLGLSMPVGNEGAGTVVAAGSSPAAQALLGKKVSFFGGSAYGEYRAIAAKLCYPVPEGATAAEAASSFVNPLTALCMIETMRLEGHTAIVHNAAASNLGQMLNRICLQDGIGLVNIVRKSDHVELLRKQGAQHVLNSSSPQFAAELTDAIEATGASLGFDPVSGGTVVSQILISMEQAAVRRMGSAFSRYGSDTYKQVYTYGVLDRSPLQITQAMGMAWGVGGWLLSHFLKRLSEERILQLKARIAAELKTTFQSHYTAEMTLAQALTLESIALYNARATGEKVLLLPSSH